MEAEKPPGWGKGCVVPGRLQGDLAGSESIGLVGPDVCGKYGQGQSTVCVYLQTVSVCGGCGPCQWGPYASVGHFGLCV